MIFFLAGLFIAFHLRFTLPPLKYLKVGIEEITLANYGGNFIFRSCPFFPSGGAFGTLLEPEHASVAQDKHRLDERRRVLDPDLSLHQPALLFSPSISRLLVMMGAICGTSSSFFGRVFSSVSSSGTCLRKIAFAYSCGGLES